MPQFLLPVEDGCTLGTPLLPVGLGLQKALEVLLGVWTSWGSQEGCQGLLDCKGLAVSSVVPCGPPVAVGLPIALSGHGLLLRVNLL